MVSNKYLNAMIGNIFGSSIPNSYQFPDTLYLGISTTKIDASGGSITEPDSSCGYTRLPISCAAGAWGTPSNGDVKNAKALAMSKITISSGTAVSYFISESKTGGVAELWDDFLYPRVLDIDTVIVFPVDDLEFSVKSASGE